jgi:PST family polysaccharide transporter
LRFLTVLMVVRMMTSLAFDILTALAATKYTVWLNAGWAAALLPTLWIGSQLDGIRGAAIAHGVVALLVALPIAIWALGRAGVSLASTVPALMRPAVGAAVLAVVAILVSSSVSHTAIVQLLLGGGAGTVVYIAIVVPLSRFRQLKMRWVQRS